MEKNRFELLKTSSKSKARLGKIYTSHGQIVVEGTEDNTVAFQDFFEGQASSLSACAFPALSLLLLSVPELLLKIPQSAGEIARHCGDRGGSGRKCWNQAQARHRCVRHGMGEL